MSSKSCEARERARKDKATGYRLDLGFLRVEPIDNEIIVNSNTLD